MWGTSAGIKLNERLSLWRHAVRLPLLLQTVPDSREHASRSDWSMPMIWSLLLLSFLCIMVAVGRAQSQFLDARDARWKIRMLRGTCATE
jgi:hypothetical protein